MIEAEQLKSSFNSTPGVPFSGIPGFPGLTTRTSFAGLLASNQTVRTPYETSSFLRSAKICHKNLAGEYRVPSKIPTWRLAKALLTELNGLSMRGRSVVDCSRAGRIGFNGLRSRIEAISGGVGSYGNSQSCRIDGQGLS